MEIKVLPIELAKAILNRETGLFIFENLKNETIRVFLINGEIVKIDSLYGEGETEIARLFLWGEGYVIKRPIPKEYENFIPTKKYNPDGFLKILIESIRKELKLKELETSVNEIIFKGLINFLSEVEPFLIYSKDEWIGFSGIIKNLSKSIKNSIILISNKYLLFFSNDIDFIFSKDGYVDFNKVDEENIFEPFDYKVFVFSPEEYRKLLIPFEKEPSYKGLFENLKLEDYTIGFIFKKDEVDIFIKDLKENVKKYPYCILWK